MELNKKDLDNYITGHYVEDQFIKMTKDEVYKEMNDLIQEQSTVLDQLDDLEEELLALEEQLSEVELDEFYNNYKIN